MSGVSFLSTCIYKFMFMCEEEANGRSQWKTSDYTYSCSYNVNTNRDAVVVHSVSHCILF